MKTIGRVLLCILLFVVAWFLLALFCGVIGSFFYDGVNPAAGAIYGFSILVLPIVGATLSSIFLYRKLNIKTKSTPVSTISTTSQAAPSTICDTDVGVSAAITSEKSQKLVPQKVKVSVKSSLSPHTVKDSLAEYGGVNAEMLSVDLMEGHEFERWCAKLLTDIGYTDVSVTQASGDQGVDVLAQKDGIKYAIQCKCYSKDLGNSPVQEVNTGKAMYHCQIGAVMTNRHFTKGAKEAAEATGILLWDRDWIAAQLRHRTSIAVPAKNAPRHSNEALLEAIMDDFFESGQINISRIQCKFSLDYQYATFILRTLEEEGLITPSSANSPGRVNISHELWIAFKESRKHEKQSRPGTPTPAR